ncbi:MAG TPA: ABC transporter permease [Fimbriiglobus sp.]|nr:ABC transporter permease [Fimbriiglobus sp.]
MRLYILRALLVKEVHRHLANRGGIALALLLIVAAVMLSMFNPGSGGADAGGGGLVGGVHRCVVQYADESPLVRELRASVPADLRPQVAFERMPPGEVDGLVTYPPGTGAIQIRTWSEAGRPVMKFEVWHPPGEPGAMAPYEAWFWRAARDAMQTWAAEDLRAAGGDPARLTTPDPAGGDLWAVRDSFRQLDEQVGRLRPATTTANPLPRIELERKGLGAKELDLRSAIATGMVVFALYFACVYLLPTLNCEERERGVLLAQALSPASPTEILAAKFLFYPTLGIALAAALAGIYNPAALSTLFFWMALVAMAAGFLGIGMTVATLAKTQRAAFMGSMCYLMSVSLILLICSQNGIPGVPYLALEFHGPRVLHAAVTGDVQSHHWLHLLAAGALAAGWMAAAGWLFRRRGWQ